MKRVTISRQEVLVVLQDWELNTIHHILSQHCAKITVDDPAEEIVKSLEDIMYGIYNESGGKQP